MLCVTVGDSEVSDVDVVCLSSVVLCCGCVGDSEASDVDVVCLSSVVLWLCRRQ